MPVSFPRDWIFIIKLNGNFSKTKNTRLTTYAKDKSWKMSEQKNIGCTSEVNALHRWLYSYQGNAKGFRTAQKRIEATYNIFHKQTIINTEIHGLCLSSGKISNNLFCIVANTFVIIIIAYLDPIFGQTFCTLLEIGFEKFVRKIKKRIHWNWEHFEISSLKWVRVSVGYCVSFESIVYYNKQIRENYT